MIYTEPNVKFVKYWQVENTGYSEISWFLQGGTHMSPMRLDTREDALSYVNANKRKGVKGSKWRIKEVIYERGDNYATTYERWEEV